MGIRSMLPGEADHPRNGWYVAAYSHEVTREPMKRKLLGKPVVLYRREDGSPVALFDRCPHRGYPLSNGRLLGDNIQCRYHGLEFDPCGTCAKVPSGDRTPARMTVDSYPLVESTHWMWIWMGDPAAADPALVPDETGTYGMGRDGWHHRAGILLPEEANYLLPFENLLDATHISFLHPGQLDAGGVAAEAYDMREEDGRILVSRRIENEEQSPLTMHAFGLKGTRAHRTITAEAFPPNLCGIRVDIEPVDQPGHRATNQLLVAITPVDRQHCLQFTATCQTFPYPPANSNNVLRDLLSQDVDCMNAIQQVFNDLEPEDRVEFGLKADRPAYRARRILLDMIRAEDPPTAPSDAAAGAQPANVEPADHDDAVPGLVPG